MMGRFRGRMMVTAALATALLATACGGDSGGSSSEPAGDETLELRLAIGGDLAIYWHVFVGQQYGVFDKHKVKVTPVVPRTGSSTDMVNLVLSGDADMANSLPDPALAAASSGSELRILNFEAPIVFSVVGKSGVESYDDLPQNFKVGVSSPTTSIAAFSRLLLDNAGIAEDRYSFVTTGGTAARLAALKSGAVDIAVLAQPADFKAEASGMKVLDYTVKSAPWYGITDIVQAESLEDENTCSALGRYFDALREISEFLADPANKEKAIAALVETGNNSESDAKSTYDLYTDQGAMMGINDPLETLKGTNDLLAGVGAPTAPDPSAMVSTDCTSDKS
ncbi:ABC transporter substrate-binding protein [Actinophytocola sp.]|uniref:ABC transporter substrate-binding protein n=1 Tax=Actinophytocola sp. TaxID=1872138 RepID=UPI003D6A282E